MLPDFDYRLRATEIKQVISSQKMVAPLKPLPKTAAKPLPKPAMKSGVRPAAKVATKPRPGNANSRPAVRPKPAAMPKKATKKR
jgi:hypothetical protein